MEEVYLGVGSNIPPRFQWVGVGLAWLLKEGAIQGPVFSRAYISSPWGEGSFGEAYVNLALRAMTPLAPEPLLDALKRAERVAGRKEASKNAPRELDLDILLYGARIIKTSKLEVPHPRIPRRRFVLEPMADLNPGLVHPGLNRPIRSLLALCPDSGLVLPLFCRR